MTKIAASDYMRGLYEIRRENLRRIAADHGGIVATAALLKISQSRVSQLVGRPFGENVARRIEESLGLAFGSLDQKQKKKGK